MEHCGPALQGMHPIGYVGSVEGMCFRAPIISQYIVAVMLALVFYTKYPDGVGDAINIFLSPDLTPLIGLEIEVLTRRWDAFLGGGTITSSNNTRLLLGKHKFTSVKTRY